MNTPRRKPGDQRARSMPQTQRRVRADPLGVLRLDAARCRGRARARAAARRLLPLERRLRVHHAAGPRPPRPLLPGVGGRAQDQDLRLAPTPTLAIGSSTRSATSSGCSAAPRPVADGEGASTAARRCAAGHAPCRRRSADRSAPLAAARRGRGARGPDASRRPAAHRPATVLTASARGADRRSWAAAAMAEEFSLLMSVCAGDDPTSCDAAFRSVVHDQTRPPDDVVLVQDGPVPPSSPR